MKAETRNSRFRFSYPELTVLIEAFYEAQYSRKLFVMRMYILPVKVLLNRKREMNYTSWNFPILARSFEYFPYYEISMFKMIENNHILMKSKNFLFSGKFDQSQAFYIQQYIEREIRFTTDKTNKRCQ